MTLEQVLLKAYTDIQFRQQIQNGTELLLSLSEQERAAIKNINFDILNACSTPGDGSTDMVLCTGRL